jgi:shikimate kinase
MAARTGLRFTEIDRVVENGVGQSLGQLLRDRGPDALTEASLAALGRALRRRPCGIIILGSAAVSKNDMEDFTPRARFLYLMRPRKVLFDRVCAQLSAVPGSLFQFRLAAPRREEDLDPLLAAREGALRQSQTTVDAGDRHPNEIATAILDILDRIMEVERI